MDLSDVRTERLGHMGRSGAQSFSVIFFDFIVMSSGAWNGDASSLVSCFNEGCLIPSFMMAHCFQVFFVIPRVMLC